MKKIKYVFFSVLVFAVMMIIPIGYNPYTVRAISGINNGKSEQQIITELKTELEDFIEKGKIQEEKERDFRVPGSQEEYNSAMYIYREMKNLSNFLPVNDGSTNDGIQTFYFESNITGNYATSQNIVFRRDGASNKKVVLMAHYDSSYVYEVVEDDVSGESKKVKVISDGINDNASSVALLLTLAKNLDAQVANFGFDIEIVFFGASSNNYAGSRFYNQGKSSDDCKNTLLMINFDKIALGDYIYFYVNEFKTPQESYINKVVSNVCEVKKLNNFNVLDNDASSPNGLDYTHVGLESDHAIFIERNINVLNIFSGNYEKPLTLGYNEKENGKNVTYTENDTYSYILTNYPNIYERLADIYKSVETLIFDDEFVSQMEKDNTLKEKYEFWTNEKLVAILSASILILFIIIYYIIYRSLLKKSKKRINDEEIDKIVIKITSNLGETDDNINNIIDNKINDDVDKKE